MLKTKHLATIVALVGVVVVLIGAVFIGLAVQKNNYVTSALREQKITLGLTQQQIAAGKLVDNAASAQVAAETLGTHLKSIAPTYGDLMARNPSGKYDPANASNLSYTQGLNMENSMNLTVLSFGVIQETTVMGVTLIVLGLAVGLGGLVLVRLTQKQSETEKSAVRVARGVAYQTE
jgi:hypothetical protein